MISWRPETRPAEPRFYDVSILKLILLWLGTLGVYHFYWHYKQWQYEQENGQDVSPVLRALFAPYTCFSLFQRIYDQCEVHDTSNNWNPVLLGILYLVGMLSFRLGGQRFWSVGFLTFLPLIPIQLSINELNRKVAPDVPPNRRFTVLQIILVALTVILVLVGIAFFALLKTYQF